MSLMGAQRPQITGLEDPVKILQVMLKFRKANERSFSVLRATRTLYRVSPTLISLILQRKRQITPDRLDDLCKLMGLTAAEKTYFRNLVLQKFPQVDLAAKTPITVGGFARNAAGKGSHSAGPVKRSRKNVSPYILSDWLNMYVKDCFHLPQIQKDPDLIYRQLGTMASRKRIQKSLHFLLKEGFLRRTTDGRIVIETHLTVTEPQVPSQKIRKFHKAALKAAHQALDLYSPQDRLANTLLICLSKERYGELLELVQEFAEKLKAFAEVETTSADEMLYQLILNIAPTGGKST